MIGQKRLDEFLRGTLEMSECDLDLLQTDKYLFLERLIQAYECHVPWQNLSFTSVPFADRMLPTVEQVVEAVLSSEGGLCWTVNAGFYVIMKELGYDVTPILGAIAVKKRGPFHNYVHIMILVKSLVTENDKYLVDTGFASFSHMPVPLDFDVESPVYKRHLAITKYIKKGDEYLRCDMGKGMPGRWPTKEGDWNVTIFFDLKPRTLEVIRDVTIRDAISKVTLVLNVHRLFHKTNSVNGTIVEIYNDKLFTQTEPDSPMEKVTLGNLDEIVAAVKKYFPNFPSDVVKASYELWYEYDRNVKLAFEDSGL
jgi:hypothetical protein